MRIIFAAAALLLVSGDAFAASPLFCEAYAANALAMVKRANDLSCGFPGIPGPGDPPWANSQWSPTSAVHMAWCLDPTVSEEQANAQTTDRAYQYDHCAQCRRYSDQALAAANANIKYACGFEKSDPDTWQTGEGHFNFCMGLRDETPDVLQFFSSELLPRTAARSDAIAQCIVEKREQIKACNALVAKTSDSAHYTSSSGLQECWEVSHSTSDFNAPDDDRRFAYCMDQISRLGSYWSYRFSELDAEADGLNNEVAYCKMQDKAALLRRLGTTAVLNPCKGLRGTMLRPSADCNLPPGTLTKKSVVGVHAITAKPTQKDGSIRARKDTASSKIIAPGLLEGGGEVFSPQGPSGTGTPRVGASSAPAVIAPPPTVYHR